MNRSLPYALVLASLATLLVAAMAGPQWKVLASNKAAAKAATAWVADALNAADADAAVGNLFKDYKLHFSKKYGHVDQETQALSNFKASLRRVHEVNNDDSKTYWASVNAFSDLSYEDFKKVYLRQMSNASQPTDAGVSQANDTTAQSPARNSRRSLQQYRDFDWRAYGKVTPIKDQGMCGCCYAFSATAAIESAYMIKGGSYIDLSEEQLMSCAGSGCYGGNSAVAMQYVMDNNQVTEGSFPYTASPGYCNQGAFNGMSSVRFAPGSGVAFVQPNSRTAMMQAVQATPVPFFWYADAYFMVYAGGIYSSGDCNYQANHGMLIVGYSASQGYWTVKNSWGTGWGEGGYVRIAMTDDNTPGMCSMYTYGHYPSVTGIASMAA